MCNIVLLFVFSIITIAVTEYTHIVLEIYDDSGIIKCFMNPPSPVYAAEADKIDFIINTPSDMKTFWCETSLNYTTYNSGAKYFRSFYMDHSYIPRFQWHTQETFVSPYMFDTWTCKFHIKQTKAVEERYVKGNCQFQLFNTNAKVPVTSVTTETTTRIPYTTHSVQIKPNDKYSVATYTTTESNLPIIKEAPRPPQHVIAPPTLKTPALQFTGPDTKRLKNNPTDLTEYVYYYKVGEELDISCEYTGPANFRISKPRTKFYDFSDAIHGIKTLPRQNVTLTEAHNNSYFECNTTAAGSHHNIRLNLFLNATDNRTRTPHALPLDESFATLSITGSPQLADWKGKILTTSNTKLRTYNYHFTEGEAVKFNCTLDNPIEETYTLKFFLDEKFEKVTTVVTNKIAPSRFMEHTFKLNKYNKKITCLANSQAVSANRPILNSTIGLHYTPPKPTTFLNITGPSELQQLKYYAYNSTTIYNYKFIDKDTIILKCALSNPGAIGKFRMYFSQLLKNNIVQTEESSVTSPITKTFELNKEIKLIQCIVMDTAGDKTLFTNTVHLQYTAPKQSTEQPVTLTAEPAPKSPITLTITGLELKKCKLENLNTTRTCLYNYNTGELGDHIKVGCVLSGGAKAAQKLNILVLLEDKKENVTLGSGTPVYHDITLKETNQTIQCTADVSGLHYVTKVHLNYIPSPNPGGPTSAPIPSSDTEAFTNAPLSPSSENETWRFSDVFKQLWVKLLIVGCLALITLIIAIKCAVSLSRRKKPLPAESNYANLTSDSNYPTLPVAAPRTIPKPSAGTKPTLPRNKVTLESTYSEPKDSQDMSEALYADPRRFVAESDTYAEPYAKSDTYAEPYKPEPTYAELDIAKELYSKPIPKAQRKQKITDESNYSNVFASKGDYCNAKIKK